MIKTNRDNASGRFVSRMIARLNPLTTSEATIHRDVITEDMVEAAARAISKNVYGRDNSEYWDEEVGVARIILHAAFAARKRGA